MAIAINLVTKLTFEIPVVLYIDRTKSEMDNLISAFLGTFFMGVVYLMYIFVESVYQLYDLQAFLGLASAVSYPSWVSIFTRQMEKGKEVLSGASMMYGWEWGWRALQP